MPRRPSHPRLRRPVAIVAAALVAAVATVSLSPSPASGDDGVELVLELWGGDQAAFQVTSASGSQPVVLSSGSSEELSVPEGQTVTVSVAPGADGVELLCFVSELDWASGVVLPGASWAFDAPIDGDLPEWAQGSGLYCGVVVLPRVDVAKAVADPRFDDLPFPFSVAPTAPGGGSFSLSDGDTEVVWLRGFEDYTVAEDVPAGWSASTSCEPVRGGESPGSDSVNPDYPVGGAVSLYLTSGARYRCTVMNTPDAVLTVVADVVGGDGSEAFNVTVGGFPPRPLGDAGSTSFALVPGEYDLSSTQIGPGWQVATSCIRGSAEFAGGETSVDPLEVLPGDDVICTVTQSFVPPASADLTVDVELAGAAEGDELVDVILTDTTSPSGFSQSYTLGAGGSQVFAPPPGDYELSSPPLGTDWSVGIECPDVSGESTVTLSLDEDPVTCTVTHTYDPPMLTLYRSVSPDPDGGVPAVPVQITTPGGAETISLGDGIDLAVDVPVPSGEDIGLERLGDPWPYDASWFCLDFDQGSDTATATVVLDGDLTCRISEQANELFVQSVVDDPDELLDEEPTFDVTVSADSRDQGAVLGDGDRERFIVPIAPSTDPNVTITQGAPGFDVTVECRDFDIETDDWFEFAPFGEGTDGANAEVRTYGVPVECVFTNTPIAGESEPEPEPEPDPDPPVVSPPPAPPAPPAPSTEPEPDEVAGPPAPPTTTTTTTVPGPDPVTSPANPPAPPPAPPITTATTVPIPTTPPPLAAQIVPPPPAPTTTTTTTDPAPEVGGTTQTPPEGDEEALAPPEPTPVDETTDSITIVRGGVVEVQVECEGLVSVRLSDDGPVTADELDTTVLDVGDHLLEVRCDDEPVAEVDLTVVEPIADRAGFPGVASALLLFLCATVLVTVLAPGAAGTASTGRSDS